MHFIPESNFKFLTRKRYGRKPYISIYSYVKPRGIA